MAVRSEKHQAHMDKWSGANDKGRRLAFMRRRYKRPAVCIECPATAHWTYKRQGYCNTHLPQGARETMRSVWDEIVKVAPLFDESNLDDVE